MKNKSIWTLIVVGLLTMIVAATIDLGLVAGLAIAGAVATVFGVILLSYKD